MYARVYVEITNACNMHCSFCHGHSRPLRQMTEEEFGHILAALDGVTEYVYYHLMGEPLTHPQLPLFLKMAKERGFRSVITTNGTLLARKGGAILDAGLHKIFVSLHSFEEGSEEDHVRYLDEVAAFANRAAREGTVTVLRLWNRGRDGGKNERALSHLRQALAGEWQENMRGFRVRDKIHIAWGDRFTWPDLSAPYVGEDVFCYGLSDHFGILADGTVVPCCLDGEGVIALGNIFDTPVADILATPRALAMKEGFRCRRASEELCRHCGYATRFSR